MSHPHDGVLGFADHQGPIRLSADAVVVGSGPGGAIAAKELAERGLDVILVEEGPAFAGNAFKFEAGATMRRLFRESCTRVMQGNGFFPTMQAIGLGGGSLVNSAISIRAPGWALDKWAEDHDTPALHAGSLDDDYAAVEEFMGISPTPGDVMGERNLVFKRGCDALGISSEPTPRNVRGCKGSAECFTGCRNGAKQSTDVTCVPYVIERGGRVLSSIRVDGIKSDGARATGIVGHVVEPFTGKKSHAVEIDAKVVVLGAGCMATPRLMAKSRLGVANGHAGKHLRAHPGLAICAMFDHVIKPFEGATQGYHSLHYLREGMKLEVLWAPPAILSVRFPGFGRDLKNHLMSFDRMAPFDVFIHAPHSTGEVKGAPFGDDPVITYDLDDRDVATLQRGLVILSEIAFAAGARAVLPGVHGVPDPITKDQLHLLRDARLTAKDVTAGANHVFGTTRMGQNPRNSVCDEWGRVHDAKGLYVVDTGTFPGSPAVNPMLTCMALARRTARRIADER